jgi:6,7-dimethyl-8-ribityllumazine synthase
MTENVRILIVEARFYPDISDALVDGAVAELVKAGAAYERIVVPGALEIPAAIRFAMSAEGRSRYDGFVALGCVIRGETVHFDIVANESAHGLQQLSLEHGLAIGNGILTVESEVQAWARARADGENKGGDAARAALAMVALHRHFGVNRP